MADISIRFLERELPSPFILASGIWGTTASLLERAAQQGCGAVTAKSCGPVPRPGHVNPTCIDWGHGLINAVGLANPGAAAEAELLVAAKEALAATGVALIASIFGGTAREFADVASIVAQAQPDFVEVNISCPNVGSEFGEPFAASTESAAEVTESVKHSLSGTGISLIVKLAPNVPSVARIGHAVVEAGADALCAVNTMPGLLIDATSGQPLLANRSGGLSGPALKPVALKCVHDLHRSLPHVPIIGTGGITNGIDAIEMLMAGATAVGIGSAIYYRGPDAISLIRTEMLEWMVQHHHSNVDTVHAASHREPVYSKAPTGAPIPPSH